MKDLLMGAPTLETLRLQAQHIRQQADTMREHLNAHAEATDRITAMRHLNKGVALCEAIDVLAERVHACITCAIDAQKPLPVCANDGVRAEGGA